MAIASILIHDPEVIILDEPTIGLDNASKKNIIKTIKSLKTYKRCENLQIHFVPQKR